MNEDAKQFLIQMSKRVKALSKNQPLSDDQSLSDNQSLLDDQSFKLGKTDFLSSNVRKRPSGFRNDIHKRVSCRYT